jgi:hypothetical protein
MYGGYFSSTRHPWPCLWFLVPLLVAYEGGVLWLGGTRPESLRNGADAWLRWGLEAFGLAQLYWAPVLLAAAFLLWSWLRRFDQPYDLVGVCIGMTIESVIFALGLWGLSRGLAGLDFKVGCALTGQPAVERIITFVGAGIYEEVLFRLVLYSALGWVLRQAALAPFAAWFLAAVGSALLFSGAHHIGPYGEAFDGSVFWFRTMAGVYFAALFQLRGFGIAVGAHACYDVLVGVLFT